jgi:hypothetical protein
VVQIIKVLRHFCLRNCCGYRDIDRGSLAIGTKEVRPPFVAGSLNEHMFAEDVEPERHGETGA